MIDLSKLSPTDLALLKQNNPALYQANVGSLAQAPAPTATYNTASGGSGVTLTPEQVALVQQNNPQLASSLSLPPLASVKTDRTLPTPATAQTTALPEAKKSSLVDFANALTQATNLARQTRQASQLGILDTAGFKPGQVAPATMANILQLLERRSTDYSAPTTEAAIQAYRDNQAQQQNELAQKDQEKAKLQELAIQALTAGASQETLHGILAAPDLNSGIAMAAGALNAGTKDGEIKQLGAKLVKVDQQGNVQLLFDGSSAASAGGSSSGGGTTAKPITSGGLTTTSGDIGTLSTALNATRGSDGYTDPNLYMDNYDHWVQSGGLPNDFIKYFPPKQYLNPAVDPSVLGRIIPEFILSALGKSSSSSNGDLQDWYNNS